MKQLRTIRHHGYSANKSDIFQDILALAVPILNHQSLPVAGINIVLPRMAPQKQIKEKYIPQLMKTGKNISPAAGKKIASRG